MLDIPGMGVKRKHAAVEGERSYRAQRQAVFNVSMCKLHTSLPPPARRVETPLLRSVLILNTLKHIEIELQKEGIPVPGSAEISAGVDFSEHDDALPPSCPPPPTSVDHEMSESSHVSSASVGSENKIVETVLPPFETLVVDITSSNKLRSVDKSSLPHRELESVRLKDARFHSTIPYRDLSSLLSGPSHHRLEDLFADIDLTVYDFDMFSSIASSIKLQPLSADEALQSFPGQCAAENYTALLNTPIQPYCKGEVAMDELDSIVQVLVGS
jgi:hypothetical protein